MRIFSAAEEPSPPASTVEDDSEGFSDTPNLLGGAYDSSGDEQDDDVSGSTQSSAVVEIATTAAVSSSRNADEASITTLERTERETLAGEVAGAEQGDVVMVIPPDEAKRLVVEKMVGFVARNGQAFEDRVKER